MSVYCAVLKKYIERARSNILPSQDITVERLYFDGFDEQQYLADIKQKAVVRPIEAPIIPRSTSSPDGASCSYT
jgi:hypothetical protein